MLSCAEQDCCSTACLSINVHAAARGLQHSSLGSPPWWAKGQSCDMGHPGQGRGTELNPLSLTCKGWRFLSVLCVSELIHVQRRGMLLGKCTLYGSFCIGGGPTCAHARCRWRAGGAAAAERPGAARGGTSGLRSCQEGPLGECPGGQGVRQGLLCYWRPGQTLGNM